MTRCMGFDFNNMALLLGSNKAHKSEKIPMLRNKSARFFLFKAYLFSSVLTNLTGTIPTFIKRVSYRILRRKRSFISLMSISHFLRSNFCNVINQNPSTFSWWRMWCVCFFAGTRGNVFINPQPTFLDQHEVPKNFFFNRPLNFPSLICC